jgi:hypothetical protein
MVEVMLDFLKTAISFVRMPVGYLLSAFVVLVYVVKRMDYFRALYERNELDLYVWCALLLVAWVLFGRLIEWASKKIRLYRSVASSKKYLKSLSVEEKEILREYVIGHIKAARLDTAEPTAALLLRRDILEIVSATMESTPNLRANRMGLFATIAVTPWAWDYLDEHRSLLE